MRIDVVRVDVVRVNVVRIDVVRVNVVRVHVVRVDVVRIDVGNNINKIFSSDKLSFCCNLGRHFVWVKMIQQTLSDKSLVCSQLST